MLFAIPSASFGCINAMLHQTFLFLGQLWQLFEVSQILEFLRYKCNAKLVITDKPFINSLNRHRYILSRSAYIHIHAIKYIILYGQSEEESALSLSVSKLVI